LSARLGEAGQSIATAEVSFFIWPAKAGYKFLNKKSRTTLGPGYRVAESQRFLDG